MRKAMLATVMVLVGAGCTPPEEKVTRVVQRGIDECKAATGDFAEVSLFDGKDEVLREACELPMSELTVIDEYHARAKTGPYDWLVGIDNETGVWVLTQVDWETLGQARRSIAGDEPPNDARERADKGLEESLAQLPDSAWIRRARFENLLELRAKTRGKDEDPVKLDAKTQGVLDELLKWSGEKNRPELAAQARLMLIEFHGDYADKIEMSLENIGGHDEWLESLINQAKKDGNKEDEQKYSAELEEAQAKRPAEIALVNKRIFDARTARCEALAALQPAGLEGDLLESVNAAKGSAKCPPAPPEQPQ